MDFLRLHLPGLHQALRGALDSLSTFVSYLMGDAVPTVEREARAAEELEEAVGRPGKIAEEGQEALESLRGSQSCGDGGLRRPGEAGRGPEGTSAAEQPWAWGDSSYPGSQADRQDMGAWEVAKTARCREPRALLEPRKKSEAGSGAHRDRSSHTLEKQEPEEQEVSRGETLRTWEQEEEEEEVKATEPGMARGAESEWAWHREPEGKASTDRQKVTGDSRETEEVIKVEAEEIEGPRKEEEVVGVVRGGQSTKVQGILGLGTKSEDQATLGREEAQRASGRKEAETTSSGEEAENISGWEKAETTSGREEAETTSGREKAEITSGRGEAETTSGRGEAEIISGRGEAEIAPGVEEFKTTSGRGEAETTSGVEEGDLPGIREPEYGPVPGERIPETAGRVWVLQEASKGDQKGEMAEEREAEVILFPKQFEAPGAERVEGIAEGQIAGREAEGDLGSEEASGEGFGVQREPCGKEAEGRQDSEIRVDGAGLEEVVQANDAQEEKGSCWVTEAELPPDQEAGGDTDLEVRSEEESTGERSEEAWVRQEALEMEWGGLKPKVTEGQGPEQIGGTQTPIKQPADSQGGRGELGRVAAPSKEDAERSPQGYSKHLGYGVPEVSETEAWESWRGDVEGGNTQEEKANDEEGEEEAGEGQALEAVAETEASGGAGTEPPEVLEADREETAKETVYGTEEEAASAAENQGLDGSCGTEAGTGLSLGESDARETKVEVEAAAPWEADRAPRSGWGLEEAALSLQDSEDMQTTSLAAKTEEDNTVPGVRSAGTGEAWDGELGRSWASEGREEAVGGADLVEAEEGEDRGGPAFGLKGPSEVEVTSKEGQEESLEAREGDPEGWQAEAGDPAVAEGSYGMGCFTWDSETVRSEGAVVTVEAEGPLGEQMPLETEAGGWHAEEQGEDSEESHGDHCLEGEADQPLDLENVEMIRGQRVEAEDSEGLHGDHCLEGEVGLPLDMEDTETTGGQRVEAKDSEGLLGDHCLEGEVGWPLDIEDLEMTGGQRIEAKEADPEGLESVTSPEELPRNEEAVPGPRGDVEASEAAGSAGGNAHSSWSEAPLPGSRLDVSVPRSRVLLSRSSSQRRSRPSFRRTPAPESQEEPPSPQPEEELSVPEQTLQLEEPPAPCPPKPEGTPVPARRRPLGHGFGLAHSGMMQELQARLGQPKPQ
ncbi:apolipoprotein B receptor isoform X2 [Tupaia chinensis]|uniref:apolipoprotein B receptor isoform X2 n=1 Tax=Tupaia chinensis TaxID=246437 RepID=UPI000FFC4CFF|nr:apolipoprotein B receptor isoform X2 [Tupaia chinensis]